MASIDQVLNDLISALRENTRELKKLNGGVSVRADEKIDREKGLRLQEMCETLAGLYSQKNKERNGVQMVVEFMQNSSVGVSTLSDLTPEQADILMEEIIEEIGRIRSRGNESIVQNS